MELSTRYSPTETEDRWYAHWLEKGYFHSVPDEREPFTIVIPPPNVTGVLHMGHMLNNTIQDILIRKARMDGKNACWIPGTDHASIATEAKVVRWLREEKQLRKADITREQFIEYAHQWKEKYGGLILSQLRKLGASCDWERTAFTMNPGYYRDVIRTFVDLHGKGKLYRGQRMVNWDPEAKTVLSNEEVIHAEENSQLFHILYRLEGGDGMEGIVIATQRPETIFADVAVAVNPKDPRYQHLRGKQVLVPLIDRPVPVIFDDYVDLEFGTGALKITPAHDINDYEIGLKHGLEIIDTIADDGSIADACAYRPLVGLDRFEARKRMKAVLEESGNLVKLEDYRTSIGRSERTQSVVEPKLSLQWFVRMSDLGGPALRAVMEKEVAFFPENFKNTYRHWMENLRDWCISRQLWWGQRIPAWYLRSEAPSRETHVFVAETEAEALAIARRQTDNPALTLTDLRQDEDVLDTWASSWLWPIAVFDGFDQPAGEIRYYYPTSVLVTGWDIIFFWVARMIMAGYEFKGQRPFAAVYFTGMVRDEKRRKMSKSLGNSPEPLELIAEFGADGVRYGLLSCSPAGGDLLFDKKLCENGRNFSNKLWNALRLVKGWHVADEPEIGNSKFEINGLAAAWFEDKFQRVIAEVEEHFQNFRLSDALLTLYTFIWDDFCSWYLEMVKPGFEQPIEKAALERTTGFFEKLMTALHPFMPFITEEIWHQLRNRHAGNDCTIQPYPRTGRIDEALIREVETAKDIIGKVREARNKNGLKPKEELRLHASASDTTRAMFARPGWPDLVVKMAFLSDFSLADGEVENATAFIAGADKYFLETGATLDLAAEKERLQKELEHQRGFVRSVEAKLSNERFVANAKAEVVEIERKKMADGLARIKSLEESLLSL